MISLPPHPLSPISATTGSRVAPFRNQVLVMLTEVHARSTALILDGILRTLKGTGVTIRLMPVSTRVELGSNLRNVIREGLTSGLIAISEPRQISPFVSDLAKHDIAVVTVQDEVEGAHQVAIDRRLAANLAGVYLASRAKHFVIVSGVREGSQDDESVRGFQEGLVQAGHGQAHSTLLSVLGNDLETGLRQGRCFLMHEGEKPGFFCTGGSAIATGLIRGLRERHWNYPGDFDLICVDDADSTGLSAFPSAVIYEPFRELGELAGQLLSEVHTGPGLHPVRRVLQPRLVER